MAQLATDSTELLDFLFDQSNGILTHDKYMTSGLPETQQFNDQFKAVDFGFTDCEADDLLNCLNEADLLDALLPADSIDTSDLMMSNAECSTSVSGHCHEDHIYSRCPDENIYSAPFSTSVGSPSTGSALSSYSYSDGGSPSAVGVQDDCYSSSSLSSGIDCQLSPLGGNMEDMSFAVNGSYSSSIFVLQSNDFVEAISTNGMESMFDNGGLVSLDIVETDVESYSDDDSTGVELDSVNNSSLFDDSTFYSSTTGSGLPFTLHDIDARSRKKSQNNKLVLSDEEKLLLAREGISIPTDVPLTKEEERALKSVRRKIRNKVSAKVSRKRKQEYVDGLEKRVKICTHQNRLLQQKVEKLEKMNQSFLMQMKKLQAMLTVPGGATSRHAQTGTCIMVLVLSFSFFILPNLGPWLGPGQLSMPPSDKAVGPGRSRSLLENTENMLFSAQLDYSDDDHEHAVDPGSPNISPLESNPFLTSQQKADSYTEILSSFGSEQHHPTNASAVSDSSGESTSPSGMQDATLATSNDREISEPVVDMSKFPAKNDL